MTHVLSHDVSFFILRRLFEEKFRLLLGVVRPRGGRRRLRRLCFQTVPGAGCGCEAVIFFLSFIFQMFFFEARELWQHVPCGYMEPISEDEKRWRRDETWNMQKDTFGKCNIEKHSELRWSLWWIWVAEGFWMFLKIWNDILVKYNILVSAVSAWWLNMWYKYWSKKWMLLNVDVWRLWMNWCQLNWLNQDEDLDELANLTFEFNAEISGEGYNFTTKATILQFYIVLVNRSFWLLVYGIAEPNFQILNLAEVPIPHEGFAYAFRVRCRQSWKLKQSKFWKCFKVCFMCFRRCSSLA